MKLSMYVFFCLTLVLNAEDFQSNWKNDNDKTWLGEYFWGNRLHDWQVKGGHLESVAERYLKMRTVFLLKYSFKNNKENFELNVDMASINNSQSAKDGAAGFLLGSGNGKMDYRAAAIIHDFPGKGFGIAAGLSNNGNLFIHDMEKGLPVIDKQVGNKKFSKVHLSLTGKFLGDKISLTLIAIDKAGQEMKITKNFSAARVSGNVGLFSHAGTKSKLKAARFKFQNLKVAGARLAKNENSALGPIISTQYTLSRNIMKLTAQLMPVSPKDGQTCTLELMKGGEWQKAAESKIVYPGYTAPFKIMNWNANESVKFRVSTKINYLDGSEKIFYRSGVISKEPVDADELVIAGFTGNHNNSHAIGGGWGNSKGPRNNWIDGMWFPHNDMIEKVEMHKPDVIFFSGDQVYEGKSPSFADRAFIKEDYLYKWYLWCWAYRDLVKDKPCICLPDDHDVYQGNIWGAGGRKAKTQNHGGYVHPADFVKMVDRTQTSHLPDPYDPTPIEQGINVYYTDMVYGRISFAILEDRKFKSGPIQNAMPNTGTSRPDHFNNPDFDVMKLDLAGLTLLGERQLKFIDEWTQNWQGADMKITLSQTIFGNMATHHGGIAEKNRLIADLDSNGWPQTGRNKAVEALRKGFSFHLAGDQHLATIVHHGTKTHRDSFYSFCVPSIANFYPRKWSPLVQGKNRKVGEPGWKGDHVDGFLNKVSIFAAANPGKKFGKQPADLHDKMAGYGIVRMNKKKRTIKMECWPRWAVPGKDPQYEGWPMTISQFDNYGRKAAYVLPEVNCDINDPVIQVINEKNNEIEYTVRVLGKSFVPKVFDDSIYSIVVSNPDAGVSKTFKNIKPGDSATIKVKLK